MHDQVLQLFKYIRSIINVLAALGQIVINPIRDNSGTRGTNTDNVTALIVAYSPCTNIGIIRTGNVIQQILLFNSSNNHVNITTLHYIGMHIVFILI